MWQSITLYDLEMLVQLNMTSYLVRGGKWELEYTHLPLVHISSNTLGHQLGYERLTKQAQRCKQCQA